VKNDSINVSLLAVIGAGSGVNTALLHGLALIPC
jgi:hypothetical protein